MTIQPQIPIDTDKGEASDKKAVIWDMDGVIADTAFYHLKAWQEVFLKRGVSFTKEDFKDNFGLRNDTIIRTRISHIKLRLRRIAMVK